MRSVIVAADLMLTWPPSVFPVLGWERNTSEVRLFQVILSEAM